MHNHVDPAQGFVHLFLFIFIPPPQMLHKISKLLALPLTAQFFGQFPIFHPILVSASTQANYKQCNAPQSQNFCDPRINFLVPLIVRVCCTGSAKRKCLNHGLFLQKIQLFLLVLVAIVPGISGRRSKRQRRENGLVLVEGCSFKVEGFSPIRWQGGKVYCCEVFNTRHRDGRLLCSMQVEDRPIPGKFQIQSLSFVDCPATRISLLTAISDLNLKVLFRFIIFSCLHISLNNSHKLLSQPKILFLTFHSFPLYCVELSIFTHILTICHIQSMLILVF